MIRQVRNLEHQANGLYNITNYCSWPKSVRTILMQTVNMVNCFLINSIVRKTPSKYQMNIYYIYHSIFISW